jgi:hypothetical protein
MGACGMAIKNRSEFKVPPLVPSQLDPALVDPNWNRFHFLAFLARRNGWTRGAELGLWEGRTIGYLLAAKDDLHMIGVDLWAPQPGNPGPEGYEGWDHGEHERRARKRCAMFPGRADNNKASTSDAAHSVPDASLDFVFVDADHSYEGCREDIVTWLPKLKATGWITGHDINWPGVRQACDELVPGYAIGPNVVWFRPVNPEPHWCRWK